MDEDAVLMAIGGFRSDIQNMGREIGQLRDAIEKRDIGCKTCRTEINADIDAVRNSIVPIKDQHTGEQAISAFFSTTLGQISVCVGILATSAALISVFVWPVVVQVMH